MKLALLFIFLPFVAVGLSTVIRNLPDIRDRIQWWRCKRRIAAEKRVYRGGGR